MVNFHILNGYQLVELMHHANKEQLTIFERILNEQNIGDSNGGISVKKLNKYVVGYNKALEEVKDV
jgi:hypothetical protein